MFTRYQLATMFFWLVSEIYWGVHSRGNKETAHQQRTSVRMIAVISIYAAFALIYLPSLSVGVPGVRLLPRTDVFGVLGTLLCGSGICFSIWSRSALGKNWSGPVTLKKEHDLVRHGPYSIVRHPIYFGSLVSLTGSAITTAEARGFIGVLLVLSTLMKKMNEEESLLGSCFAEYADYRGRVKKILPFIYIR